MSEHCVYSYNILKNDIGKKMPHIKLALSNNIQEREDIQEFFHECHTLLVRDLPTKLDSCKSRLLVHDVFRVGDGIHHNGFIHLEVRILPGREDTLLNEIAANLLKLLQKHFAQSLMTLKPATSVEIATLQHYHKV
ncbi:MAG: hypothetical protein C0514_01810 [Candidatus Puniceispirillum sp.]|nr:hypothetical protein [Candidatus Puniceispirillum sp.]